MGFDQIVQHMGRENRFSQTPSVEKSATQATHFHAPRHKKSSYSATLPGSEEPLSQLNYPIHQNEITSSLKVAKKVSYPSDLTIVRKIKLLATVKISYRFEPRFGPGSRICDIETVLVKTPPTRRGPVGNEKCTKIPAASKCKMKCKFLKCKKPEAFFVQKRPRKFYIYISFYIWEAVLHNFRDHFWKKRESFGEM